MTTPLLDNPLATLTTKSQHMTVDQYHELINIGHLGEKDNLELIEGYLVQKMSRNPPHDGTIDLVRAALLGLIPPGWWMRVQQGATLPDSEPEPDVAVVRGNARSYLTRHPGPADFGMVIEVSDSSLAFDREDKARIYARAGLPVYWIVNLVDRQIEVYEQPSGPTSDPTYGSNHVYKPGDSVLLVLDGNTLGTIPVSDLLP